MQHILHRIRDSVKQLAVSSMKEKPGDYRDIAKKLNVASTVTVRSVVEGISKQVNQNDSIRRTINLAQGDPSLSPSFRTSLSAEDAVVSALRSAHYNCYSSTAGILPARKAIAEYLSRDLPQKLSPDDVYLTVGCNHSIEVIISVIATLPNANILLPRPGYPLYESRAAYSNLQVRHYDLLPDKGWEVDLDSVKSLADENTIAMVVVSPGNPCGNVFWDQHLKMVAETAKKLGIFVIADEVYAHLVFGTKPFVPMAMFASTVPVITMGSISKRWIVPGWRLGWIVASDPDGILKHSGIIDCIKAHISFSAEVATFIQGALPQILEKTKEDFFSKIINTLKRDADICETRIREIPCIDCPHKPEGSMSLMVKLNLSLLEDINDDEDFCHKLAREESVIVLPGFVVGLKNWLRITFATEPMTLGEGLDRMVAFCKRHSKQH